LEDVLIEARAYARRHRENALFTFNGVNFVVNRNSDLVRLWSNFIGAPKGETVGPCEGTSPETVNLPAACGGWTVLERMLGLQALERLRTAE
jgi:hypothetical protein